MTRARNSANLASQGNLFVDIANDRTGIGSVVPAQNLHVAGTAGFHADVTFTGDNAKSTFWDRSAGVLKFNDNAYVRLGTGNDMSIYHDGTNNIIAATVPKNLLLQSDDLQLQDCSNSHLYVKCVRDSYVRLYHDNSTRFQTTAYGTDTTGTAVNDGLVVAGVATVTTMNVTGVLTYDDVTSVDSVGIVTARQGVRVPNGSATTNYISVGDNDTLRFWGTTHQYADFRSGHLHFRNGALENVIEIQQDKDIFLYGSSYFLDTARFDSTVTIADTITHHGDTDTKIRFPGNDIFTIELGGTEHLRVDTTATRITDKLAHTGDPNTMIRFPADDTFTVETNAAERFRINSTGDIGINFSGTPAATLDIRTDRDPANGLMCFLRNNAQNGNGAFYGVDTNSVGSFSFGIPDNTNAFAIVDGLGNSGTERFRIDSNGHVRFGSSGDGFDSAWADSTYGNTEVAIDGGGGYGVLHFRGDGAGSTATRFSMGVGDDKFYMAYDDVDGRHNIVVNGAGNVGINKSNPATTLDVNGTVTATLFAGSGASLSSLNGSNIASGTVPVARIGTGTKDSTTFYRGDGTFQVVNTDLVSDTSPQLGGDLDTNSHHILLDDDHQVKFGDDNDFAIYYNTSSDRSILASNGARLDLRADAVHITSYDVGETMATFTDNGAVELYYDGAKTLETTVNALHLFGNTAECNIDLKLSTGVRCGFLGFTNSGRVQINGAASGNAYETYLEGNLNGSTKLFYDNSVRIETMAAGAKVKRHSGGATTLFVEGAEGSTAIIDMFADDGDDNADKFRLQASTDGTFLMQNYASGGWETNIRTSGNGAVDLYYDNGRRFTTKSNGFEALGGVFTFYGVEGGESQIQMYADEGDDANDKWRLMAGTDNTWILGNLSDGSWDDSIKAIGDGAVELYHNDTKRLETIGGGNSADGINVFGNASNSAVRMSTSDGTLRGILYANSSNLIGFLGSNGNWALSVANAGGNTVSYNNVNPSSGNSLDLGSSSAHWRRLYTGGITVSDNGVSDEILKIRADDQAPWLFNLGNDTYHSTNGGLWGYQSNGGDFYLRYRGNSEYKTFYIQRWNGSTTHNVAHFDYYGRFGGYYQNTLALQTAVDGIDVYAGADNQNGEIRIRPRGTAVYSTLSFYSAAGASVGSVGTHSGASTIYYVAANSGSHLFHFGGAYKLHLTSSTVKPQTGVTLDLGTSSDPFNDLFIKNGTCSGTGAFKVSAGTTAQRPTGANGQLRYNSTLNILEGYINGAWTKVKGTGLAESGSYANNTQAIADDLYAYWSCDSTSTTRDGGDSGSATLYGVSSSGGKISNSWDRGTSATNGMNLTSMPTGNNWTLMFWLYLSSNAIHSSSDGAGIIWLDSTQAGSVLLGYDGSGGNNLRFGGNGWVADGEVVYSSFGTTGVWRHMVITHNSNSWKFYLDGSLITTRSESLNNNGNWWLANYSRHGGNTNNHYFRGRLDEIAIWHRTLSAGEITETYNAQSTSSTQLVP